MSKPQPTAAAQDTAQERVTYLEAVRGLACLQVFFLHLISAFLPLLAFGAADEGLLGRLHHSPLFFLFDGYTAVYLFFVLSGYVLTRAFDKRPASLSILASARVVRLAVPVMLSVLVAYGITLMFAGANAEAGALVGSEWLRTNQAGDLSVVGAFKDAFIQAPFVGYGGASFLYGFPGLGAPPPASFAYNAPMWTLSIELYGALIVYFLCASRKINKALWWGVLLVLGFVFFNMYMLPFLVGHLMAHYQVAERAPRMHPVLGWGLIALGVILCVRAEDITFAVFSWAAQPQISVMPQATAMHMQKIYGACLIFVGITQVQWLRHKLSAPRLSTLGAYSFALYLCHWAFIFGPASAVFVLAASTINIPVASGLAILTAIGLSIVGTHLFKRIDDLAVSWARVTKRSLLGLQARQEQENTTSTAARPQA